MFNIKWNGNQVIKETTSGLFKKEIGYNEQVMKEQEKLKVRMRIQVEGLLHLHHLLQNQVL